MAGLIARNDVRAFLLITFALSAVAGVAAFAVGGAQTFSDPRSLPLLLLTIWAPNVGALVVRASQGRLGELWAMVRLGAPPIVWLGALLPLAVAVTIGARVGGPGSLPLTTALALVGLNLVMGPLGEELGWRGFLLPELVPRFGWLGAALAVGAVWALWHLPLWWLPSPHRAIPFPVFAATVVCLSVVMTALWRAGGGALGPMVLFHLAVNVGVGWLDASGVMDSVAAWRLALPAYAVAALAAAAWLGWRTRGACAL